jgi:YVTN family beta-propeller protein
MLNSNQDPLFNSRKCLQRIVFTMLLVPIGMTVIPATAWAWTGKPLAYVPNELDESIGVIDTGDNLEVQHIPTAYGAFHVVVTPDANHVYVTNTLSNLVSVIDTTDKKAPLVTTISGIYQPTALVLAPDGKRLYVTGYDLTNPSRPTVSVIDTATHQILDTITVGNAPLGIVVTPDGTRLYVSSALDDVLDVIDTSNDTVLRTVSMPDYPWGMAMSADGTRIYVANGKYLSVVDTSRNSRIATVTPPTDGGGLQILALTPDGKRVYTSDRLNNSVLIFNTATNAFSGSLSTPYPDGIGMTPDGARIYVTSILEKTVSVFDAPTGQLVARLANFTSPVDVGIAPPVANAPAFKVDKLAIDLNLRISTSSIQFAATTGSFDLDAEITLTASDVKAFQPDSEPVKLKIGTYTATVPAGAFTELAAGTYGYEGSIDGVLLNVTIKQTATAVYTVHANASKVGLAGVRNPVQVAVDVGSVTRAVTYTSASIGPPPPQRLE